MATPINSSAAHDSFYVQLPDWLPFLEGQSLNMWVPNLAFSFVLNPFGYVYFAYKTPSVGYMTDDGNEDPKKWGVHPFPAASRQYEDFIDSSFGSIFDTVDILSAGSLLSHVDFSPSFNAILSARFTAAGLWDFEERTLQGDANALGILDIHFSLTEQFGLGPVPCFISFSVNSNASDRTDQGPPLRRVRRA